jgi:beta-fructofuranosidase
VLLLDDHWTWDFWLAHEGRDTHLFFLKAPRSLGDPDLRHHNARIGHAVSRDLREWTPLPDALDAGEAGSWDDLATWTGSVVHDGTRWWMFYTGVSAADAGLRQRIGRAWSDDLQAWHKDDGFLLEAPEAFEQLDTSVWPDLCWRDPYVFADPQDGGWAMLVTARVPSGAPDARGVVALLRSRDLRTWTAEGPVTSPGDYGHMEVPQVVEIGGRHYLVFCAYADCTSAARQARVGRVTGTHVQVGSTATGPFEATSNELFAADAAGSLYAGKVVRDPLTGGWALLAFLQFDASGTFIGGLSDPVPIIVHDDGLLRLTVAPADVVREAVPVRSAAAGSPASTWPATVGLVD